MKYQELVEQITPELYSTFKRALERGRWPDGREMSSEQRRHCLDAVIAYDALRRPEDERIGYIDRGRKGSSGQARPGALTGDGERTLRFADQQAGSIAGGNGE